MLVACTPETLSVPAPAEGSGAIAAAALPPMSPSVVDAPISYALEPALDALERLVPRRFGDIERRIRIPSNSRQRVAFEATRTPFAVAFDGDEVTLVSTVSYQGRGWYNPPLLPTISASCGTDNTKPRVRIVVAVDLDLAENWSLKTRSRVKSVRPETDTDRDQCRVTAFKIDVTDRVVDAIRPQLQKQLPRVDRKIAAFDMRKRMDRWYNLLNKGIRVHDSLWLVLSPQQVRVGDLRLADGELVADVRLFAQPHLVSGPKPPDVKTPLPPLLRAQRTVGDSAHLRLEGLMTYSLASDLLAKELVGFKARRFGRSVRIARIRVFPLNDGRLALAVGVEGDVAGEAYLVGTPVLDTIARRITVPDLDFDVATQDALVSGLAWLRKGDLVEQLRKRAQLPLEPLLNQTREQVEKAINRELATGVELKGTVRTGRLVDVAVQRQWLLVRAEATGTISLEVDRKIKLPGDRRVTDSTSAR